uniref:Uncharacterized protein n=1 Tax=Rhizophora mucronata TaxID=61149 RepID=A0A2P2Q2E6_RHIMU
MVLGSHINIVRVLSQYCKWRSRPLITVLQV